MKTVAQWISELEEPYRFEAFEIMIRYNYNMLDVVDSLDAALYFDWSSTRQGEDYWYNLVKRYQK